MRNIRTIYLGRILEKKLWWCWNLDVRCKFGLENCGGKNSGNP
jgi:hypothetical protein